MWALASARRMRSPLIELLARELAPFEGRAQAVLRIATACSITVAIAMVFQIPEPTYMAYIVFLIAKDESSATVTAGVGAMLAVTLSVFLNLGLLLIGTAEPALRLPAMALATFVGMYSVRTFALGPFHTWPDFSWFSCKHSSMTFRTRKRSRGSLCGRGSWSGSPSRPL